MSRREAAPKEMKATKKPHATRANPQQREPSLARIRIVDLSHEEKHEYHGPARA